MISPSQCKSIALAALLCAATSACMAPMQHLSASNEAELIYLDGMEHLAAGSLLEAQQEFIKLMKMPSYLALNALARLRLADAQFQQHKYDESIETYLSFVQRHDSNENVPYAMFMVAKAYFELAPSDLLIMPPIHELDLTAVQQARVHLERFVRQFPRSRYATEALQLRDQCIELQWANNRYVVHFYFDRKKWIGVVSRLHQAAQAFPQKAHNVVNYSMLAQAYDNLHWRSRAVDMYRAIGARWPDTAAGQLAPAQVLRLTNEIAEAKAKGEAAEMPAELPPTAAVKPEQLADQEGV